MCAYAMQVYKIKEFLAILPPLGAKLLCFCVFFIELCGFYGCFEAFYPFISNYRQHGGDI